MKIKLLIVAIIFAFTSKSVNAQVPSYVPTNGLVGYWPFDGNASDASGNGNNGVVSGSTHLSTDRFSNSNSSYIWDGTNSPIIIPNNSSQNFQNGVTFSVWLYQTGLYCNTCNSTNYITKGRDIEMGGITLGLDNNSGKYYLMITGSTVGSQAFFSNSSIIFNNWTNLTGTYDGSTIKIYINGVLDKSYNYSTVVPINNDNILFGKQKGTSVFADNYNMLGNLDDIGIWNRALTQQEISNLYNGNINAVCNIPQGNLANGLVAYYPFCGNANDESGNANNGIVNGATLTTDRFGTTNNAYSFDGVSNYISVNDSPSLRLTSFTVSAWVYYSNSINTLQELVHKDSYPYNYGINMNATNKTAGFFSSNGTFQNLVSSDSYSQGVWHHIVLTHDGSSAKQYVDNVLINSSNEGNVSTNSQNLYFGALNGSQYFFNGVIDDIGIWNRALTPQEITDLFNGNLNPSSTTLCWSDISTGLAHSGAIKPDRTLWTWGTNNFGELGYTSTTNINNPAQVGTDANWLKVVCASHNTYAIKTDGTLWAWGNNGNGQLGNGTYNNSSLPIQIGNDNHWKSVSAFQDFAIALKTDGTIWAWGFNIFGMLGDGTNIDRNSPVQVGIDTNWKTISAGAAFSFAIKTDGTLWNWGYILSSNGSTNYTPIQVGTDTNWKDISAGGVHVMGLKNDNSLWAWGQNSYGQLGNNTNINNIVPTNVLNGATWKSISACGFYSMAIKSDGTLWTWGRNDNYQLGDGTQIEYHIPHQIGVYNDWSKVLGFFPTSYGLRNNELWHWGTNGIGELIGNGTPTQLSCDILSINENFISKNEITIYPNPTNSSIYIDFENKTGLIGSQIRITNTLGQEIYHSILNRPVYEISLGSIVTSGLYFVSIIDNDGKIITTKKIILQ